MTQEELQVILEKHKKWLNNENGGERANLSNADLHDANLRGVVLCRADLHGADLQGANLQEANLRETNFFEANLREANFYEADLHGADLYKANLYRADLCGVNLRGTNFYGANLQEANFYGADLCGADLQSADLRGANFQEVNIRGTNFWGVKNIDKTKNFTYPDLYILKSVEGKIKAYKLVNGKSEGIFNGGLKYKIGKVVEVKDFDDDERVLCGRGINVATLSWCKRERDDNTQKILEVEFDAKDIVAIPYATDGKFRVRKCKVIKEVKE